MTSSNITGAETETEHPERAKQEQLGGFASSGSGFAPTSRENKAHICTGNYRHCMNRIAQLQGCVENVW